MGSPNDAAERLLRVSAPPCAIAASHFPRDHRWPDRVPRPTISRVDRRIKQEGPDGGEFARQMRGEALHVGHPARPVEPLGQAVDQMPAGHGEPVRRDLTGLMGIAYRQRVLKMACTSVAKVVRG